jgi:hypothetical protein
VADAIKRYTRRQLRLYYEAALRAERRARADRLEEIAISRGSGRRIDAALRRWRG